MLLLYFGPAALGIVDHLRCRFARFNLRADLLDLRGLLFELRRESLYLFLLLRHRCLQLLNFEIELGLLFALMNILARGGVFEFGGG